MKIEELQDLLDLISNDIHSLRNKVLILDSCLEEITIDGFNLHVCKAMLREIDIFIDISEDVTDELVTLKARYLI
jgi:hypothetical protein